jgi:hypothetical protein
VGEKIAAVTLTNHLQLNKLLHVNQFGFLRNTSTEHNLLKVFNFIGDSLNKGNYCIGVFYCLLFIFIFYCIDGFLNLFSLAVLKKMIVLGRTLNPLTRSLKSVKKMLVPGL